MRPSETALLEAWDTAPETAITFRALELLHTALPEQSPSELARLTIGQRDRHLLALCEQLFGRTLVCLVACPQCGERLEFDVPAERLRLPVADDPTKCWSVECDGYDVAFHLPNSNDLSAIEHLADPYQARIRLLERCVVSASCEDGGAAATSLPEPVIRAVGERMAELDPMAAPELRLDCSDCGHTWQAPIDLARFLLTEVDAWARKTLHQVDQLARAYGWTEGQVLDLSPRRRARYLDLTSA